MSSAGYKILNRFKKRWHLLSWLEVLFYGLAAALLSYAITDKLLFASLTFLIIAVLASILRQPWKTTLITVSAYIDKHFIPAQYSSGLLLSNKENLSSLAQLQRHKISQELKEKLKVLRPPHKLHIASVVLGLSVVSCYVIWHFNAWNHLNSSEINTPNENKIVFSQADSSSTNQNLIPQLTEQNVQISYPPYTHKKGVISTKMSIKAVEGTKLSWRVQFDAAVAEVYLESTGKKYPMRASAKGYKITKVLKHSGFYNFRFKNLHGDTFVSDLYALEAIKDKAPAIKIIDLKQFTSFSMDEDQQLSFNTHVTDDFGIANAAIVATVSKGSGEAVKFREEKLNFENAYTPGNKILTLRKTLNLTTLKMEPGDELYFYVEATDLKTPKPNKARSETFFAVIKDTIKNIDQLPDYFRSQRQLIMDTEKLIKERPNLSVEAFKFRSNELGFDQKALRLKYAEFMGEETESGLDTSGHEHSEEEHEHEDEDEDPLAAYTHDHDDENEHNLVPEEEKIKGKNSKDPLAAYIHDHGDPESSTLFTQSLKSKLRQALNEMWDAELHLRLYDPQTSLPYQYRALKLIQEIKNSARIYVHRIGFDPPPIKEDKRLSGKIEAVSNFYKNEDSTLENQYLALREAVTRITVIQNKAGNLNASDNSVFEKAGNELAILAIANPGKYLKTLQQLKALTDSKHATLSFLTDVQRNLLMVIPALESNPNTQEIQLDTINTLLLKELEVYD